MNETELAFWVLEYLSHVKKFCDGETQNSIRSFIKKLETIIENLND